MKLSKQWSSLGRDAKQAWMRWAKSNPVLLENGEPRRVSGAKAFTIVLQNRAIAAEPANINTPPAAINWITGALTLGDAGPYTAGAGYVGFRTESPLTGPTQWFVFATKPVDVGDVQPLRSLQFIKHLSLAATEVDQVVASFANEYRAVHGSFNGPGANGDWSPAQMFIWIRLHQYHAGQLAPGVVMKGQIQVEL